tara:strand:- start:10 stop:984 length:975 start_codon:yes stop_codon:yes gene_type:complete
MAFLDNSGDIILDAVLTDTGRKRMARGDGTFRIVKFALGDEEINYNLYSGSAPSGQEDLDIMQTPILEAFTNNTSIMNSFLQTYTNNQTLLYLPVIKINDQQSSTKPNVKFNSYLVATNAATMCALSNTGNTGASTTAGWNNTESGIIRGYNSLAKTSTIRLDQGINNNLVTSFPTNEFYENQYLIEMDSRFGQIVSMDGDLMANPSFIDDDQIASYYLSKTVNGTFITDNPDKDLETTSNQVIAGARGTILQFSIQTTPALNNNASWFTRLGGTFYADSTSATDVDCYYIDTIVRVTGLTTGYRVDVPVRYVRIIAGEYTCSS